MSTSSYAEVLSSLLQSQWTSAGTGLLVSQVYWSHVKFDAVSQIAAISQSVIVSTYNPENPVVLTSLSKECNHLLETVVLDIILKPAPLGGIDSAISTREAIKQLFYSVIHAAQSSAGSGWSDLYIDGEYIKGELPDLLRLALRVKFVTFEVLPA
jgi:hypothetical protein